MLTGTIKKTMHKALENLAKREQCQPFEIGLFIHTKNEELIPEYFYTCKGEVKTDAEDNVVELDFVKDILGKKIDMLGMGTMAGQWLKNYLAAVSEQHEIPSEEIYIQIGKHEDSEELSLALLKNTEIVKPLTLEEVFE